MQIQIKIHRRSKLKKNQNYTPGDEDMSNIDKAYITKRWMTIDHFWVPKTLTFKMRPSAQPILWKGVLFGRQWKIISISKAEALTSSWYRGPGGTRNWPITSVKLESGRKGLELK